MITIFGVELQEFKGLYNLSQVSRLLDGKGIDSPDIIEWLEGEDFERKYGDYFVSGGSIEKFLKELGQTDAIFKHFEVPFYINCMIKGTSWLEKGVRKIKASLEKFKE